MNGQARLLMRTSLAMLALACLAASAQNMTGQKWNPHTGPPAEAKYVGEKVCVGCHVQEAEDFLETPMARAGQFAGNAEVLQEHPQLKLKMGPFRYLIVRKGNESICSVTDGKDMISAPILWAFGDDVGGQTYILRYNGAYYQSRVSFFKELDGLAETYGAPSTPPQTLEEAFGERLSKVDAQSCIACHTSGAVVGGMLQAENSVPGVSCEACHGPGAKHVAALQGGNPEAQLIFNPARLSAYELDEFCGSCHRTWEQVGQSQILDIKNVRFQPYRLARASAGTQRTQESAALPATTRTSRWSSQRAFTIRSASHAIFKRELPKARTIPVWRAS
jgi:hypothetical protein